MCVFVDPFSLFYVWWFFDWLVNPTFRNMNLIGLTAIGEFKHSIIKIRTDLFIKHTFISVFPRPIKAELIAFSILLQETTNSFFIVGFSIVINRSIYLDNMNICK